MKIGEQLSIVLQYTLAHLAYPTKHTNHKLKLETTKLTWKSTSNF